MSQTRTVTVSTTPSFPRLVVCAIIILLWMHNLHVLHFSMLTSDSCRVCVQGYATENGLFFLETSAKTAANVNELFMDIAQKLPKADATARTAQPGAVVLSDAVQPAQARRSSCC